MYLRITLNLGLFDCNQSNCNSQEMKVAKKRHTHAQIFISFDKMKKHFLLFLFISSFFFLSLQVFADNETIVPEATVELVVDSKDTTIEVAPTPETPEPSATIVAEPAAKNIKAETEEDAREDIINEEIIGKTEDVTSVPPANTVNLNSKSKERIILGWVEPILLGQKGLSVDAKLTPGTAGNALHADNIVMSIKKGDAKWLDFDVTDKLGRTVRFHKKVISMREKSDPKDNQYKVTLEFCLNMQHFKLDFIVSNRSDFEHSARIGRDSLAGHFIIDPGLTKISVPSCK